MSKIAIILALAGTVVAGVTAYLVPQTPLVWQIALGVALLGYGSYFFSGEAFF